MLFQAPLRGMSRTPPALPDKKLLAASPETYWARVRGEQFFLPNWRAFLNNGSLGVIAKPVYQSVVEYLNRAAALEMEEYPRWGYERLDAERTELAAFLGCSKDELALTHNCTEAMSTIANGLDLKPGDEVLTTDQEHSGGLECWRLKQARAGVRVRTAKIPVSPKNPEEVADRVVSAIGPATRVLSFSGITTTTGLVLPVESICRAAREKGVVTVVDGAHMNGQIPVNLSALGCDYFAGSPHKWMFAPAGCGILYGRGDQLDHLWPAVVSGGWDNKTELKAARFMMVGTNNRAIFQGMIAGVRLLKALGPEEVFSRLRQLSKRAMEEAQKRRYVEVITPDDGRLYGAMVAIQFKTDPRAAFEAMRKKGIWILGGNRMRLSFHVHTRPEDIESFFDVADQYCNV